MCLLHMNLLSSPDTSSIAEVLEGWKVLPPAQDAGSVSLLTATLWYWLWIFFKIMNYVVVLVPTILVNMLQKSFLVELLLQLILTYLFITALLSFLVVRHKYLTRYSKETAVPKSDKREKFGRGIDYVTKNQRGSDRSKNYLDEFLSAIKVFGYLERPVFHELTKNMTTQKLAPDEILYLDERLGFSIVVEGTIQVYTKIKERSGVKFDEETDNFDKDDILVIDKQQYQLLNEVKSGSPLSSLLSTLDLFSANRSPLASPTLGLRSGVQPLHMMGNLNMHLTTSTPIEPISLSPTFTGSPMKEFNGHFPIYTQSPSIGATVFQNGESIVGTPKNDRNKLTTYPDIVAKPKPIGPGEQATTATIAIIPNLAFQRVQSKYPKATSHIVTMVLTRLYKVTMNAVHQYLGLTKEIFDSEKALNDMAEECKLPSYLYDGVIESFKRKADSDMESDCSMEIIPKPTKKSHKLNRESSSRYVVLASRSKPSHPGDLLSSVPLSRKSDYNLYAYNAREDSPGPESHSINTTESFPSKLSGVPILRTKSSKSIRMDNVRDRSFSDEREETEETSLRIAIVENLFKLLGIEESLTTLHMLAMCSGQFSTKNSMVGLSTLMNDNAVPISGEMYVYDSLSERTRWNSVSSVDYFKPRDSVSLHPQKFYNTIHQSILHGVDSAESDANNGNTSKPARRYTSSAADVNFSTIKNSFSKYLEVKYYKPGTTLVEQDSFRTGLFYVIDGSLDVEYAAISKEGETPRNAKKLYSVHPGGLAGYLSSIVGFRSLVSIKSSKDQGAIVAYISKDDFSKLMDKFYFLQLPVAAKLKSLLPELILTIDFALEWCHIPAGGILCSQGDLANGFHIVLSGRFRVVRYKNLKGGKADVNLHTDNLIDDSNSPKHGDDEQDFEVLGEYGHGQSIGEVEVLTASRRTNTLIAVRDSETARIPRALFEMLSLQNPSIMVKVSRIVASRVLEGSSQAKNASNIASVNGRSSFEIHSDYKTITVLPSVSGLPVREFADKLVLALKAIGRNVIALDQTSTLTHLGRHAFDERLAQLKLSGYFAYLEEEYETVVYVCDSQLKSNWTSACISQGDCILLLADAEDDECATNVGDYERLLIKLKTTARTDLCLIHPEKSVLAGSTSIWLKKRIWVQGHHHIQMEIPRDTSEKRAKKRSNILADLAIKLSSKANPNIKMKFESVKSRAVASLIKLNARANKIDQTPLAYKNDFLRLARILSNQAVGLVLGGGGSRGISHVGVVTALEKHGIPVDLIGGTSIGSFVGGLYAKEHNIVSIYGMSKKFSRRIGSIWRSVFDLTYPVTSYITGYEFNRGIWKVFGYHEIEDFWIQFFCNSTNITNSNMEIHETGYAWRFIRASMSLAGLLPPITFNGSMLLDGGYLDNLPVMEMKNRGAKYIIAVDVGSVDDRTPMNYGDTLSGFWVLFNRINPFSKHPNVPNMMDIQLRLAYVASVNALELAKKTPGVIYLRPPIDDYATLDFLKFDEIYNVGLAYADGILTKWEKEGKLPNIAGTGNSKHKDGYDRKRVYRRNSI